MKTFILTSLSAISAYFFISCKKTGIESTVSPTSSTLKVNAGVGSGTFRVSDTINVFSNAASNNQVFDKWTGDIAQLQNPNKWRTTLKMRSSNASITATYKTIISMTFTNVIINGSQVYYYVPPSYKGIILPFHGAGGNATGWVNNNLENLEFCKYAISSGYALVITEGKNRTDKKWDASGASSVDIANIDIILNKL